MLKSFGSGITCLLSDGNSYIQAGRQAGRQADRQTDRYKYMLGREIKDFSKGEGAGGGII